MRARACLAAAAVLLLLLLSGCGGGSGDDGGGAEDEDSGGTPEFLLAAEDLPGFTKVPRPSNWPPVYAACADDPLLPGSDASEAKSTSFLRDETGRLRRLQVDGVESYAVFADSVADAERTLALVAEAGFRTCVQQGLEVAQEETVENQQVTGSTLVDLPTATVGDGISAFRVTVDEDDIHIDHELTVIRKGRALAFLFTGRLGTDSYPDGERQSLASVLAARMP